MESFELNPKEIQERVELNSFLKENLDRVDVEGFTGTDLLTNTEIDEERVRNKDRDKLYERFQISTLLKFLLKEGNFEIREDGVVVIEAETNIDLPEGYGFKGGAARSALRESLGLKYIKPRDYDLIKTDEADSSQEVDDDLARKYMGKDFEFGDGVEYIDPQDYFDTRDFTINETYVVDGKLYATQQCIRDTIRGIVRVTEYERNSYGYEGIGPKMKAKTLRLYTEQLYMTGIADISDEDRDEIIGSFINPFWIAVQLDRAFERSEELADRFTESLKEHFIISYDIENARELVVNLEENIYGDFYFRSVPDDVYELEDEEVDKNTEDVEYWEKYFDAIR